MLHCSDIYHSLGETQWPTDIILLDLPSPIHSQLKLFILYLEMFIKSPGILYCCVLLVAKHCHVQNGLAAHAVKTQWTWNTCSCLETLFHVVEDSSHIAAKQKRKQGILNMFFFKLRMLGNSTQSHSPKHNEDFFLRGCWRVRKGF